MEELKQATIDHKSGVADALNTVTAGTASSSFVLESETTAQKGAFVNGRLPGSPDGEILTVNGKAYEPGTIDGVEWIKLKIDPGVFYDYTIIVNGACPNGYWNNEMTFTDESGGTYTLHVYDTSTKEHTVRYHSHAGALKKITWDI